MQRGHQFSFAQLQRKHILKMEVQTGFIFMILGAANENMFLEAFNQGLIMHEMGGFEVQKAREVFNMPEDYEMGIMIAIGYQDTYHVLPDRLREKVFTPRVRKPLSEIAFIEKMGNGIKI